MSELKFKHGVKSYEIIEELVKNVYQAGELTILDLTFGVGRFYRKIRDRIIRLIAVDIAKYDFEVAPDEFHLMDAYTFTIKVISGELKIEKPDLIVVDPPWSQTKRGYFPKLTGLSHLPYHMRGVDASQIIDAAVALSKHFKTPILYRYKERLPYKHLVHAEAEVKIMGKTGIIHYGVIC
jgi:hypothetical protein